MFGKGYRASLKVATNYKATETHTHTIQFHIARGYSAGIRYSALTKLTAIKSLQAWPRTRSSLSQQESPECEQWGSREV